MSSSSNEPPLKKRVKLGDIRRSRPTLTCGPFCRCLPLEDGSHPRVARVLKSFWEKPHILRHEAFNARDLVSLRRYFHERPELSYKEKNTSEKILKELREYDSNANITKNVDGTFGLWCDVSFGDGEGPFMMIRADMDALPIHESEKPGVSYRSKTPGISHACGHDGHMAILLTVGKVLMSKSFRSKKGLELSGRVRLLFQPAEEGGAGAKRMIAGGCLNGIDRVYGLHLWNMQPVGTVGIAPGAITANSDRFQIIVRGSGGHGSGPHDCVDAIVVGSQVVSMLQTIVSRSVDPSKAAVVSVGTFNAGYAANVISDVATLKGTVRTRDAETKKIVMRRMREICDGIAAATGARVELEYKHGYPATISTRESASSVRRAAQKVLKVEDVVAPHSTLAGEDFSFYLQKKPGAFFFVGSGRPSGTFSKGTAIPHHRSDFEIDERSLEVGVSVFLRLVEQTLSKRREERAPQKGLPTHCLPVDENENEEEAARLS